MVVQGKGKAWFSATYLVHKMRTLLDLLALFLQMFPWPISILSYFLTGDTRFTGLAVILLKQISGIEK